MLLAALAPTSSAAQATKPKAAPRPAADAPGDAATGESCVSAYEEAQEQRRRSRLLRARAELLLCQRACPTMLTRDCDRWLAEITPAIPTVSLSARDAAGLPLSDVRVRVDGAPLAETVGGGPLEVDPGAHVFVFERHQGGEPVEARLTLQPSERGRAVSVVFPDAPVTAVDRSPPLAAWVLGGVAVAGLGAGAVLGIKGHLDRLALEDECSPACSDDDVQPIRTQWWIAGVSAGVGAAAGIAAALIWLTDEGQPTPSRTGAPRALRVQAAPRPGGAYGIIAGEF